MMMWGGFRATIGVVSLLGLSVASAASPRGERTDRASTRAEPPPTPSRIVSVNLPADEILLGLLPPSRIRALSVFADDPQVSHVLSEARRVPRRVRGDAERILALEPDVIFSFPFGQADVEQLLRRTGVPIVHVPGASTIENVRSNIRMIGTVVGASDRAEQLVRSLDCRLDALRAVTDGLDRPRVLLWNRGGFTAGEGTLFDELLTIAGGVNVAKEAGVRGNDVFPMERVLSSDPEVILFVDYRADGRARELGIHRDVEGDPLLRSTKAVRKGRVYTLPGRYVLTASHHVAEAAFEIARRVHGDRSLDRLAEAR